MSRQDIENAAPVRIALAESMARTLGFKQIIIFGHAQECGTVVTTWGEDAVLSAQAAAGANHIKKQWGWPEDTIAESGKVLAMQARIDELQELLVKACDRADAAERAPVIAKPVVLAVHVIEGTEYERGWGQRPDGYVAFPSAQDAAKWIKEYDLKYNNEDSAPDEYTKYSYIGLRQCSAGVGSRVTASGYHINRIIELNQ